MNLRARDRREIEIINLIIYLIMEFTQIKRDELVTLLLNINDDRQFI